MEIYIKIIGIWWLVIHYNDFIEIFNDILKNYKKLIIVPKIILSCPKCAMFWTSLIITHDICLSSCLSILAYLFDNYIYNNIKL